MKSLFAILITTLALSGVLSAEDRHSVRVKSEFRPDKSLGLVLSQDGTLLKIEDTNLESVGSNNYSVGFGQGSGKPTDLFTAALIGSNNQTEYGRMLSSGTIAELEKIDYTGNTCSVQTGGDFSDDLEILRKLYQTRSELVGLYKEQLRQELDNFVISNVAHLEKKAGLEELEPLDAENFEPESLYLRLNHLSSIYSGSEN